jgi:GPI mannosyltransferase 3
MGLNNLNSTEKKLLGLALIVHLITAYFSNGFYHWDEHFQIFEFANFKLGHIPASYLPWEFASKMRPFILPGLATFIGSFIADPFINAGLMRLLAMVLSFYACLVFYQHTKDEFKPELYSFYLFASFFLWFLPFLHVRVSAEIIGGALFIIGYCLASNKTTLNILMVGFLFGLAFWIRFQLGFALLGLGLGYLMNKEFTIKEIFIMVAGFLLAVGINVAIDSWGYGQMTFTPWQYLNENIFLGKSKNFGVNPISDYFKWILNRPGLPIGILFYLAIISQLRTAFKHPLTLSFLFFVSIHFLVGHKEIRFLFPLVFLLPYFVMRFLSLSLPKVCTSKIFKYGFIVINLIPMMYLMNANAHPSVDYFKQTKDTEMSELTIQGETDPYKLAGLDVRFYQHNVPRRHLNQKDLMGYIFSDRVKYARSLQEKSCQLIYSSNSILMYNLNSSYLKDNKRLWTLYKCQN